MEQNTDTGMPMTPVIGNKQKSGNGLKVATVIACIVAICGIGFGVYGMMQSAQKDNQIADLKVQVEENNGTITAIENPKIEAANDNNTATTITNTIKISGGPYIENGVFYVPEWGLKFNIPSDLANYGYSVDYDEAHGNYSRPSIGFTAMLKSDIAHEAHQDAYYDNIGTCAIVDISKEAGTWTGNGINGIIKQFDSYALLIWNYSRHGSCDHKLHIDEVQEKIQTMFSNPEAI